MRIRQLEKRQWSRTKGKLLCGVAEAMVKVGDIIYPPLCGDRTEIQRRKEIFLSHKPLLPPDSLVCLP